MNTVVNPAGAQAIITVNYGSNPADNGGGDTNVAAAWVNYANNVKHWGIKYWEIGNEVGGNGYAGTSQDWEYDLHYPETNAATRVNQPALSPAAYGTNALQFIRAMKGQDPTIRCGLGFDPGDATYNSQVLSQTGTNADFIIIHWYPGSDAASTLAASTGIVATVTSSFTQLTNILGATQAAQMKIAVTETGSGGATGAAVALYAADNYLTWLENGIVNVDYQILHTDVLANNQTPAHAYYGALMARLLAKVGDTFLKATSAQSELRIHATARADGKTGVMLVNLDPLLTISATVNIGGATLATNGVWYQFGLTNYTGDAPTTAISSNVVTGLGNQFTIAVPPYTMIDLLISAAPTNTSPVLAGPTNRTVNAGQALVLAASATDTDQPPQTLTFSLLAGPNNATVNTNSGAIAWRPLVTQAATTNIFTLKVTDSGSPNLSATQSFTVTVNPLVPPSLTGPVWLTNQLVLTVNGATGPDYAVQISTNLLNWNTIYTAASPGLPFNWTDTNGPGAPVRFYRVAAGPPLP